ncbi:MAG: tRNA pseudouridine(38-40) synthase TruA [Bdellovibrionota bacterium]
MSFEAPLGLCRFAIRLSYAGTDFCGWQTQKGSAASGAPSIQDTINTALRQITRVSDAKVIGSGRTDAGVHALAQVAHTDLPDQPVARGKDFTEILANGLNGTLPASIRIIAVRRVSPKFHAQHSAKKKQYSYYFQQGSTALPHLSPFSWWIRLPLDQARMNDALKPLIGEHDFKPFQASGANPGPTIRTVYEAEVTQVTPTFPNEHAPLGVSLLRFRIVGSGFLKQMVRGIAGTLLQVGEGYRPPSCIQDILNTQIRRSVGPTAPARGLWLERVWYEEPELSLPAIT